MADAFIDTGYLVALLRPDDPFHDAANRWAEYMRLARWQLVTTTAILGEMGDEFRKHWHLVQGWLPVLLANPSIEVVAVTTELVERAVDLRNRRLDKEWGLTDCISLVVMEDRGLRDALAADRHFEQAGFRTLLRTEPPDRATSRRGRA